MALLRVLGVLVAVLYLQVRLGEGTRGVDVSTLVSESNCRCLKSQGYDFLIMRGYRSIGSPDPSAAATLYNCKAAGVGYLDVYLFPCPKCSKSATEQVDEMVNALRNVSYGQIWLDIEGSQYWLGSESANQKFFEELLSAASSKKTTGVYASEYQWSSIMGSGYTGGSRHQLWYAHYDNDPSFNDFRSFGGWTKPSIKQYEGDKSACGVGVDLDYY